MSSGNVATNLCPVIEWYYGRTAARVLLRLISIFIFLFALDLR